MGSSNKASRAAEQEEAKRKAEIKVGQARVNSIFDSPERQQDYLDVTDATRALLTKDLDRQKVDADLQTKFALARNGLTGGSADIDQNRRGAENYLRGIVEAERRAKGAGNKLQSEDMSTKSSLFSQILGGMDSTTAAQQAAQSMQQNIALTRNQDYMSGFDNNFGNMANFWKQSKESAGDRRAAYDFNSLYGNRQKPVGSVAGSAYG